MSSETLTNIWNALVAMRREIVADHYHALCSGDWSGFDEAEDDIIAKAIKVVISVHKDEMPSEVHFTEQQLRAILDAINIGNGWLNEGGALNADETQFYEQMTQVKKDIEEIVSAQTTNSLTPISRPRV